MTDSQNLLALWGKTTKGDSTGENYHPALFHMVDVGVVAEALLQSGDLRLRQALLHAWNGVDSDAFIAWLPFLCSIHDLGKISAVFQGQRKKHDTQQQYQRLKNVGIDIPHPPLDAPYHQEISAVWIQQHIERHEGCVPSQLLWAIRDATGGHHGRFTERLRSVRQRFIASEQHDLPWHEWREQSYVALRDQLLPQTAPLAMIGAPDRLRPATIALSGFLVLCDWLASDNSFFPATSPRSFGEYVDTARKQARKAINQSGVVNVTRSVSYPGMLELFPYITKEEDIRPLQKVIETLPDEELVTPALYIIEAPPGEGKTEAALILAQRIAAQKGYDGLYFGLPTMATSNQMFIRLERFYKQRYDSAVTLIHGQAGLIVQDLRLQAYQHESTDEHDHDEAASAQASLQWFTGAKKALLAPFGAGTVDQIELAGLLARHYMLRLYSLAGKVVVVDEVHAYDTYMSSILEHTLEWLAALGSTVILLSATLPRERHRMLATRYVQGLDTKASVPALPDHPAYPLLSRYAATTTPLFPLNIQPFRKQQHLQVQLVSILDAREEAQRLLDLVAEGGAVARICNRVDDAQAIYEAVSKRQQVSNSNSYCSTPAFH